MLQKENFKKQTFFGSTLLSIYTASLLFHRLIQVGNFSFEFPVPELLHGISKTLEYTR